ncbi:3'(2'),5'-bisphosphate nucleotidase CysQ [Serratia marcescens]|uniref:3'(2'),5-bisphosphonucleoside 3'(2')-phosphohydrolase n=1 Tax=Serratia marcescens TaxID=615 RepID=A0A379Y3B4_SERMA|nr:3'(2'),5'-bisphosphate nucleotidase CysQ [Serratia marcescens]
MMLERICQLSREAGAAIMAVYDGEQPLDVAQKKDDSPVTAADLAAHHIIKRGLAALTPEVPLLSEEDPPAWEERRSWTRYWLVDPLDGTKEFLHRNGEFTVNIALIEDGQAVMGVVYAPAIDVLYLAERGKAWKEEKGVRQAIGVSNAHPPLVGGEPLAYRRRTERLFAAAGRAPDRVSRFLAEVLSGGGRQGAALSALRADQHLGYRRRACSGGGRRGANSRLAG